jgi:hypothetical protein
MARFVLCRSGAVMTPDATEGDIMMNRSRLDAFVGTAILGTILLVGALLSNLVPSPYRETAVVIDPIMDRLHTSAAGEEAGDEQRMTLTGARVGAGKLQHNRYVN